MKKLLFTPHVLSLISNGLVALAGFISIWALSRILNSAELGQWLLFLTAFTFADMLRSGLIHTALVRYAAQPDKSAVAGSAWVLGIGLSLILGVLIFAFLFIIAYCTHKTFDIKSATYLQILILVSFPYTISLWLQQANELFNRLLYLRLSLTLPFLLFIITGLFVPFSLEKLIQVYIAGYLASSVISLVSGWSYIKDITKANIHTISALFNFGKYSMGTVVGANLLKSTDTYMISWYMGPAALAVYHLPYKLIEIVEIPIRSMVATYLPQSVKCNSSHNLSGMKFTFYQYAGLLTICILPFAIISLVFAEQIMALLGGETYASSANIFRCFVIYSLFLPLDRFLGITLDIINKPHLNLLKVYIMVGVNVISNYMAITFFNSPVLIAIGTIITVITGVLIGWFTLKITLIISFKELLKEGHLVICRSINKHFRSSIV